MTIFILVLLMLVNFFLQSSFLPYFSIFDVVPNTSIILIICIALFKGKTYGSIFGLFIGLLQDIVFSPIIGINAFIYFFLGYLLGIIENNLVKGNLFIPIIFSTLGVIYYNFLYYVFTYFLSQGIPFLSFARNALLIEIVYTIVLSIPIYMLFSKAFISPTMSFNRK